MGTDLREKAQALLDLWDKRGSREFTGVEIVDMAEQECQLYRELRAALAADTVCVPAKDDLRECLQIYVQRYPAFRTKPVGGEGSLERIQQQLDIELEDHARELLAAAAKGDGNG